MTTRTLTALCLATALLAAGATNAAEVPEGISDGITVHGHWKIEVFEPDETLVSVTEFENALVTSEFLRMVLTGQATQGRWGITLSAPPGGTTDPCLDDQGQGASCWILEPGDASAANHFLNLTISGLYDISLTGSATAAQGSSIGKVATLSSSCDSAVPPASCSASVPAGSVPFTMRYLDTPVDVLAGQIIQVTVTISFS